MAEEMGDEVPSVDDFLGEGSGGATKPKEDLGAGNTRRSLILPAKKTRTSNLDTRAFDQKLVDRALSLLLDF